MLYVDTSILVAALSNEMATQQAQAWLAAAQEVEELAISDWTIVEISSAFAIKLRTGEITLEDRAAALSMFNALVTGSFVLLAVASVYFRTAGQFVDQHSFGLRAADALHLATASHHGATLYTLDHRLAAAGPHLGVSAHLLT